MEGTRPVAVLPVPREVELAGVTGTVHGSTVLVLKCSTYLGKILVFAMTIKLTPEFRKK